MNTQKRTLSLREAREQSLNEDPPLAHQGGRATLPFRKDNGEEEDGPVEDVFVNSSEREATAAPAERRAAANLISARSRGR